MTRFAKNVVLSCAAVAAVMFSLPARAVHGGDGMQWGEAPPMLPKGAKVAVLKGDPMKAGPYVLRLKVPAGYKVAPHQHSQAENLTVISGTFAVGQGDKFDAKAMKVMKAGAFGAVEAKTNHYAMAKTAAVVQVHGDGPFDITYVDPKDDPSKGAAKQ